MMVGGSGDMETCTQCGSVYRLTHTDWPSPEAWQIPCEVCGAVLKSWKGTRSYEAKLIERKAWPQEQRGEDFRR